jgi:hypothetical protein
VRRSVIVGALGTAQTLAWGSSYYLPAILADPIAHGLGLSRTTVFCSDLIIVPLRCSTSRDRECSGGSDRLQLHDLPALRRTLGVLSTERRAGDE